MDHHVFMNLESGKIYCLPDSYEVVDSSLDDIKYCLHPTFDSSALASIRNQMQLSVALDSSVFLPGFVGLNDISHTDWLNASLQSLVHIPMLRDFFLVQENYAKCTSLLVRSFGELIRKMWNPKNFKGQVSPQEVLQAISILSDKKFRSGSQSDPLGFLSWFLNTLHRDLGGTRKLDSSIIFKTFQGELMVRTERTIMVDVEEEAPQLFETQHVNLAAHENQRLAMISASVLAKRKLGATAPEERVVLEAAELGAAEDEAQRVSEIQVADSEFGAIDDGMDGATNRDITKHGDEATVALLQHQPRMPEVLNRWAEVDDKPEIEVSAVVLPTKKKISKVVLEEDAVDGGSIIPQVPLFSLLQKFDGRTPEIQIDGSKRFYSLSRLPRYLLIHLKRFVANNFTLEKNPTIVNFPIKNLQMRDYLDLGSAPTPAQVAVMGVRELRSALASRGLPLDDVEKQAMQRRLLESFDPERVVAKFDLVANLTHTGLPEGGSYKTHIYCPPKDQWFDMENLHVTDTMPQLVAVSEAYLQFYELQPTN